MRLPLSSDFGVRQIKSCVGAKRQVDVIDCSTQQALTMSMKEWCEYYESEPNKRLKLHSKGFLNVISLEFSHTKLESYVEAPRLIRQLDWIENAWPLELRRMHTESSNQLDKMLYPKVQKYVLMSVAGCYTDFHIDMGGSSVWYHIVKGEKVFWLIPPTEANLKAYERWVMSGKQLDTFLADSMANECERITLKEGQTFFMPSGWIHAVYTPVDSIVFGGNFLHSYNIPMQLCVNELERRTKVPIKYQYPFFIQMHWYVALLYVNRFGSTINDEKKEPIDLALSNDEYEGLRRLYEFLTRLADGKRCVPAEILDADRLLYELNVDKISVNLKNINIYIYIYMKKIKEKFFEMNLCILYYLDII
jgi:F-box and leucine-rich repeat protein 10/11